MNEGRSICLWLLLMMLPTVLLMGDTKPYIYIREEVHRYSPSFLPLRLK